MWVEPKIQKDLGERVIQEGIAFGSHTAIWPGTSAVNSTRTRKQEEQEKKKSRPD
jgi:hypothetical protein